MEKYNLDTKSGVQVDYWANQMQMYMICGDLFSQKEDEVGEGDRIADGPSNKLIVTEDDLIPDNYGQKILLLRLKNCTGNIIDL